MSEETLNEREKTILRSVVQQFILTATPVGSRNVAKKYDIGVSPATVRNIMADLEDSGYINHPHTSAGRIPTDKGYRYYVDSLMNIERIPSKEKGLIEQSFNVEIDETDDLIKLTSKLLSSITKQLACVTYPNIESGILEKIQIVSLTSNRILIVISIQSGLVKTITMELSTEIKDTQVLSVQSILNERLSGLTLANIRSTFKERFKDVVDDQKPIIRLFVESVDRLFKDDVKTERIILTGAKNVISQPEFGSPENFQSIIELIEDKDVIIHIMEKSSTANKDEVFISIGSEHEQKKLNEYSFVSKEYQIGESYGTLGIIGPKRMAYSKIVAIVDYVAKVLSESIKSR
ncbi:MAG: heat-inducible transcriptional repressor HrcA [Ignavibacteria bacterium]|nr:heat-inducible transcriptional repressor HrcA [Ignavibacteria bacterium]MBT8382342.1 heat-inducible transcriptional repressor HrcA [Ignavibacteria bacterium]MBT8390322.1 heat-inducible transcriptional repressor HrcA [Ignavibacteria bacterium]NNJ53348.1 heat-inducible transcription repressor HrcA [Ignavibacteriaceae bacterium]NNL22472.1 heat-inducible transcription repressor HrcA [Ignavibacteriaceae bacterium]